MQVLKNLFGLNKKISADTIAFKDGSNNVYTLDNYLNNKTIYDSGSNDNGDWIRYTDGTMICMGKKQISTTRNSSYGALYVSPKISAQQYPKSFTTIFSVVLNAESQDNSAWLLTADLGNISKTPTCYVVGATSTGSQTYYINYIAIGKWK